MKPIYKIIHDIKLAYIFFTFNITIYNLQIIGRWTGFLLLVFIIPYLEDYIKEARLLQPLAIFLLLTSVYKEISSFTGLTAVVSSYPFMVVDTAVFIYLHFALGSYVYRLSKTVGVPVGQIIFLRNLTTVNYTLLMLIRRFCSVEWVYIVWNIISIFIMIVYIYSLGGREKEIRYIETETDSDVASLFGKQ